jgi:hypothetical protein
MRYLLSGGHSVVFAGNEWQRQYIEESFPAIETIHLEGYNVSYSRRGNGFMFSLFYQMPRLLKEMRKEHEWLLKMTEDRQFDGVISDNRYGLFHPTIPSVFMTHQLLVQSGVGDTTDNVLRGMHYKYIDRFSRCWVVDVDGKPNLSGKLAHPTVKPANTEYLGLLSQLAGPPSVDGAEKHLLILLSGPEPQRTILSELLWEQVQDYEGKVIFVEGSNASRTPTSIPANISHYTQVTKQQLEPLISDASLVVCRSGYSTLMDLVALEKKAILIPTPGQTEQEYLGKHLHKEGVFFSMPQRHFDLKQAMQDVKLFPFTRLAFEGAFTQYERVVVGWVDQIKLD